MLTLRTAAAGLFFLAPLTPALADWTLTNNHKEPFVVHYKSENNQKKVWSRNLAPGATLTLELGVDKHLVEIESKGGTRYEFEPVRLEGRKTKMSEILTPKGKKNGRQLYEYMNQKGFYERN